MDNAELDNALDKFKREQEFTNLSEIELRDNFTEMALSERFVKQHGQDLKFDHEQRAWFFWTGKCWERDRTGAVARLCKETVLSLYEEASNEFNDDQRRQQIVKFAQSFEKSQRQKDILSSASIDKSIVILREIFDSDLFLFNLSNGTLDLKSGFREHRREDLISKISPVEFDPNAEAPRWEKFLIEIFGNDMELINFIQRAVGYSMSGDTSEQCLFILYGEGANGKTTFLNTLQNIFGDYALTTEIKTLLTKKFDGISNDIARLVGARFVIGAEAEAGRSFSESLLKQLTGGDKISARFLRQEAFEFTPQLKLWLATNKLPKIRGRDVAIWRRVKLIPFEITFTENEQDKELGNKLLTEKAGIINWAFQGFQEWQNMGLETPEIVDKATLQYKIDTDPIGGFVEEHCIEDSEAFVSATLIYEEYKKWADKSGERQLSQTAFGKLLTARGFEKQRFTSGSERGKIRWQGIGILNDY